MTLLEVESSCGIATIPKGTFAIYKANSCLWLSNIPRIIHDPDRVACVCNFVKVLFIRIQAWLNEIFAAVTSFICSDINGSAPVQLHIW